MADPLLWRFDTGAWVQRECRALENFRIPHPAPRPPPVLPRVGRGMCLGPAFPPAKTLMWLVPGQPVDGDIVLADVGPVFRHVATDQAAAGSHDWLPSQQRIFIRSLIHRYRHVKSDVPHRLGKLYRIIDGEAWLICNEGAFRAEPHRIIGRLTYCVVNGVAAFGSGPLPRDNVRLSA